MNKFFTLLLMAAGFVACRDNAIVERMTSRGEGLVDEYVASFNATDEEIYIQEFDNSEAADFMKANVPYFECPDKELEKHIISAGGHSASMSSRLPKDM